jgi:predicted flap endonuclease-1-like 5' DNA nuclease
MNYRLSQLRTIAPERAEQLKKGGLTTAAQVLRNGATPDQRKALAERLGLDEKDVLTLVNRADLSRIKGIGPVFSDLLEYSGVDTVVELARRVPENLHEKMAGLAAEHNTKRAPRIDEVKSWIEQAKSLERKISY